MKPYNILEARIEYSQGKLHRITVLVEMSENDIRAIFATTLHAGGYMHISPNDTLSEDLLQRIAGYGRECNKEKFFPIIING